MTGRQRARKKQAPRKTSFANLAGNQFSERFKAKAPADYHTGAVQFRALLLTIHGGSSSAEVIIERISKIFSNFSELYFYDASSFAMSKRGRRDLASLKLNSVDLRREDYSQKSHFYASRQRGFSTPPEVRRVFRSDRSSPTSPRSLILTPPTRGRFTGDAAARQRVSIQHLFQDVFGSPP